MDYCALRVRWRDIDDDGINSKIVSIPNPAGGNVKAQILSFTLKKEISEEPNTVVFDGNLYLIDKRDERYFECIKIKFADIEK